MGTSAVLCNACGGIGHLTKDCQQKRPGAAFVKTKETNPEVIDKEYQSFLSDLGIKYGADARKAAEEKEKSYVPPMGDAARSLNQTASKPLMLTNGSDAPGAASAY